MLLKNPPKANLGDGSGVFPQEYARFVVMREMGWTYQDYITQPNFIIEQIIAFMNVENRLKTNGK